MADLGAIATVDVSTDRVVRDWRTGVWWATQAIVDNLGPGGAVGVSIPVGSARRAYPEFGAEGLDIRSDFSGTIGGSVLKGTVPQVGVDVSLFHRTSRSCLATVRTDANGEFVFHDLYKPSSEYFAIAFSPTTGDPFNALIYDMLTPV